jgi:hypothetical protein
MEGPRPSTRTDTTRPVLRPDPPVVLHDDAVGDAQPDTPALTRWFGREELVELPRPLSLRSVLPSVSVEPNGPTSPCWRKHSNILCASIGSTPTSSRNKVVEPKKRGRSRVVPGWFPAHPNTSRRMPKGVYGYSSVSRADALDCGGGMRRRRPGLRRCRGMTSPRTVFPQSSTVTPRFTLPSSLFLLTTERHFGDRRERKITPLGRVV